ncbi:bacterial dnaA family protein [Rickettsia hoogstraalii str. RCCE3]|uniref:HdaA/DnaA family protein n=1 Tax=Rickettsia hoogstraalii TaxID=467174 RepID=UPI0005900C7B|nr:DnaA/Hda family protein [Rickettsia hoogstraalii]KJV80574.1 bacterial dnaA family protein [Rickettsia hoogstraalii str. RCCE3]
MQQYIFRFITSNKYHPDEFIVSSSNEQAYNIIKNWQCSFGVNPYKFTLLIKGPSSSGKTYLTKIWQNLSSAYIIKDIFFNEEILEKYNAFIIEDIENWQEPALLHIFNIINEKQKYLLLTSSDKTRNFTLPDLSSRIKSVLSIALNSPDDELIKILIFKHFSISSVTISGQIIDFLLVNLPREYSKIIEILENINHFALISKRKITTSLVKEVLNNYNHKIL